MIDRRLSVGPLQCNCRLLACPRTGEALLVDPGDEAERIVREIQSLKTPEGKPLKLKYLLHTHAHFDHIGGTRKVRETLGEGSIALHADDAEIYRMLPMQGRLFGFQFEEPLPIDHFLEDEEELQVGDLRISVLHTPGHSPGGVCFRLHEDSSIGASETLFSGDTLFQGSVGRTDLWGGDQEQMFRSIRSRIFTLDDDIPVCPGHGPDTQVGIEKRENPFLN